MDESFPSLTSKSRGTCLYSGGGGGGVSNGQIQLKSAHKIWPLLELLAKLNECPPARSRKSFATAHKMIFQNIRRIKSDIIAFAGLSLLY